MKILLLEDDLSLREIVTDALQNQGYHVSAFKDGESAMDSLLTTSYDLMLLDINVPGINGYDFLEALRDTGNDTPTIFISSYTDIDHLSKGYELGCNDYLRKPFSLKELELRVRELLKTRRLQTMEKMIKLGEEYAYDTEHHELFFRDASVNLVPKERLFVDLLVQHRGSIVPIDQILDYVWEGETNMNNLRVLIYKLRRKLPKELVTNVKGVGYRIG